MKSIGQWLLSGLMRNCAHPRGVGGKVMLWGMNRGHGRVYRWVMEACPFADGMRVLDVGCGGGGMARELRKRFPGMRVDGVDVSEESVATARKVAGEGGEFQVAPAEALPAGEGTYDAAISVESVYFWPDLGKGLRELLRVVRADGFAAAAVECSDPEKAQIWTERVGEGMKVRTAAELAEAFRGAGFADVEAKEDVTRGLVCVIGRKVPQGAGAGVFAAKAPTTRREQA